MEKIRKHFIFSGRVQGVGFRYRSMHMAQMLGLTGWVKNNWDGDVEMEWQSVGWFSWAGLVLRRRQPWLR